jgi:nitroimidazol reductase NimA-like FMN-containing flavoprotein (pyridoxamine 5'-phosphate oxidase superfamily)
MSSQRNPTPELLSSNTDHLAPTPWTEARRRLDEANWYWLATASASGRPHVRPVLAVWRENTVYFVSGPGSRKARNLVSDTRCTMTMAVEDAHLVVEGTASIVRDEAVLRTVADAYATKYAWHVQVVNGAFSADYGAPTAGPPPYDVYALQPVTVYGFGTDETWSPTRWRF